MDETNEFYDSLDEADKFDDESIILSGASIRVRKKTLRQSCSNETVALLPPDLSTILPLYGKETSKSDLHLPVHKKRQKPQQQINQINKNFVYNRTRKRLELNKDAAGALPTITTTNTTSKSDNLNNLLPNNRPQKSYLGMFYNKIGYKQGNDGKLPDETARGTYGDESYRTAFSSDCSSNNTTFSDAMSFVSDSSSFYFKVIEDDMKKKHKCESGGGGGGSGGGQGGGSTGGGQGGGIGGCGGGGVGGGGGDDEQLKSVSEYSFSTNTTSNNPSKLGSKASRGSVLDIPAVLGSLGPDPVANKEKMIKFKRQQSYGQKVSNQNRMKFMEKQILKNFKIELKKSTKLNKCASTVLNT